MRLFIPERVFFESSALNYPLGQELHRKFERMGVEIAGSGSSGVTKAIEGADERQRYARSKKTLVIGTKKGLKLDVCRPSADYQFSLATNCPGSCEYCYLQTTQGYKPYLRAYVNLDDIFRTIKRHITGDEHHPTTFEAASSGDPLALEHLTGTLSKTVEFFGKLDNARLRVVTKFDNAEPLLNLEHRGHTRFRVSVNTRYVIDNFEHNTASLEERITAASKIAAAGYPAGFIIAPIMIYEGWESEYSDLLQSLRDKVTVNSSEPVTFELIQHRFTPVAKKFILERFPNTKLNMDESRRMLKWGKFGRFKYVYPREQAAELKEYVSGLIRENFPDSRIEYFT